MAGRGTISAKQRAELRAWMREVMRRAGWSAAECGRRAQDTSPSNITRFLRNDHASVPSTKTLTLLASVAPIPPPNLSNVSNARQTRDVNVSLTNDTRVQWTTPIQEIDVYVGMGGGGLMDEERTLGEWQLPTEWLRSEIRGTHWTELRIVTLEGDSMAGTLEPGDKVIVDLARKTPSPPGLFVIHDGLSLVAKRLEYIEGSEPPKVRVISDNERYRPYERTAEEIHIAGRIMGRWQRLS